MARYKREGAVCELLETMINYNPEHFVESSLKVYLEKIDAKVVVEVSSTICLVLVEYGYSNRSDSSRAGAKLYEYLVKPYRSGVRVWRREIKDIVY